MLKKLGILSVGCLALLACQDFGVTPKKEFVTSDAAFQQPTIKMPSSLIVCRAKQCAPSKLSMSKEFVFNTLLHMLDSNARRKALVCAADANTHSCTEEYVSVPITVGITPAYMYVDDVKITDVAISQKNTSALNLILNWNVSYNGQTPICRPSKTLMYTKNVSSVVMEDNGYSCKMTTIGTSTIKTLFAVDYIDLDFGYIGGYYSIGVSGPAFGGGSGYMILRLPEDITLATKDFRVSQDKYKQNPQQPSQTASAQNANTPQSASATDKREPAPNVDTIIKYNHAAKEYTENKAKVAKKKKQEAEALNYEGVKVFPVAHTPLSTKKVVAPALKNALTDYNALPEKADDE